MRDYINWLLDEAYVQSKRADGYAHAFAVGALLGAFLIWLIRG